MYGTPACAQSHVVVVDPRPSDYHGLAALAEEHGWHIHLLTTASAAMRFTSGTLSELWMINIRLPEMSGIDLLEMLRERHDHTLMLIVSDRYDIDDEQSACRAGAASYLCKDRSGALDCMRALTQFAATETPDAAPAARANVTAARRRQPVRPP